MNMQQIREMAAQPSTYTLRTVYKNGDVTVEQAGSYKQATDIADETLHAGITVKQVEIIGNGVTEIWTRH